MVKSDTIQFIRRWDSHAQFIREKFRQSRHTASLTDTDNTLDRFFFISGIIIFHNTHNVADEIFRIIRYLTALRHRKIVFRHFHIHSTQQNLFRDQKLIRLIHIRRLKCLFLRHYFGKNINPVRNNSLEVHFLSINNIHQCRILIHLDRHGNALFDLTTHDLEYTVTVRLDRLHTKSRGICQCIVGIDQFGRRSKNMNILYFAAKLPLFNIGILIFLSLKHIGKYITLRIHRKKIRYLSHHILFDLCLCHKRYRRLTIGNLGWLHCKNCIRSMYPFFPACFFNELSHLHDIPDHSIIICPLRRRNPHTSIYRRIIGHIFHVHNMGSFGSDTNHNNLFCHSFVLPLRMCSISPFLQSMIFLIHSKKNEIFHLNSYIFKNCPIYQL